MSAAVLAALELGDRLKDYGAYAGVASIFGLAVLSLLYFGQARELKRLREWAGREPERAAEREAVLAQQRQVGVPSAQPASVVAQPRPATAAVGAAQPRARQAAVPATAAGGATQVLKPGELPGAGEPPATPAPGLVPAAPANGNAGAPPAATPPAEGEDAPKAPAPGDGPARVAPPGTPVTAAGTPAPPLDTPAPRPRPTVQIGGTGSGTGPRTPAGVAAAGSARRRDDGDDGRSAARLTAMVVGGIAAAALVAILLVTVVFGGGDSSETAAPRNTIAEDTPTDTVGLPQAGDTSATPGGSIARGEVRIAVLNGTTADGLAREAMSKLTGEGYQEGTTDNAPDRTLQSTQVLYAEGFRRAAQDVAKLIGGVTPANIVRLDRSTQVVAGEDAKVVVVLGADKT